MLPQEIKALPNDDELIFKEGCKPIRAKKNWFFKDKQFTEWTKSAPVVIEPFAKRPATQQRISLLKVVYASEQGRRLLEQGL